MNVIRAKEMISRVAISKDASQSASQPFMAIGNGWKRDFKERKKMRDLLVISNSHQVGTQVIKGNQCIDHTVHFHLCPSAYGSLSGQPGHQ